MQPFTAVSGAATPLMMSNIDTDVIIRVERMTSRAPAALKKYAFEALRYLPDGTPNEECPLNQAPYLNAPILLAGSNFGCGSSREPAVWSLMALGFRCVIAESFGDIFFSNCFQNGVLAIRLPRESVEALAVEAHTAKAGFTVDLVGQIVQGPSGNKYPFEVDPQRRESLIEGLDEVGQTLKMASEIDAWQAKDRQARPWVWLPESVQMPLESHV